MSSRVTLAVENLGKCYQIYESPRDRLLQMLCRGRRQYYREFWALQGVSFEVNSGEVLGIVGRNGSGKSTLLQLICGTLEPSQGSIQTFGRMAALLELGSAFNPEFTGRENIYLNGAVLGLSNEEIESRFDAIAGFADIGDFLEQPIKTYSTGMVVRLAFAVQAQVEPNILIVDEALAVGDAKFQAKCFERLRQLKENGTTILLVTHSTEQVVTHCSRAILLDAGRAVVIGKPKQVVNHYLDLLFGVEKKAAGFSEAEINVQAPQQDTHEHRDSSEEVSAPLNLSLTQDLFSERRGYNPHEYRWGDGRATILDFFLKTENPSDLSAMVSSGEWVTLRVAYRFNETIIRPIFGITLKTKEGITIYGTNSEMANHCNIEQLGAKGSQGIITFCFQCGLSAGDYFISLGIASYDGAEIIPHDRRYDAIHFTVGPTKHFFGLTDLSLKFQVNEVAS